MKSFGALLALVLVACAGRPPSATPALQAGAPSGSVKLPTASVAPSDGPVERIYELPVTPGAPALGSPEAKVQLEVCSDFECPYCAQLAPLLRELHENYGELLRIVWRSCPLPFHAHAVSAAEAALEVHAQRGDAAFWAYHDALFAQRAALDDATLVRLAGHIEGVDAERVRAALKDRRHESRVKAELMGIVESGAAASGVATPATFINGRLITGAQPYRVFEDAVERALQEQPAARAQAEADSKAAYPMARVRHILVQYVGAQGAGARIARSKPEAEARARTLRERLTAERDFEKLAREESDCPSAQQGGALGRFTRGELEPSFEDALFALSPGETSGVVETPFGYHILRREE